MQQGYQQSGQHGFEISDEGMKLGTSPPEVRNGFIRKVYSLLTVQLIATTMIVYAISTQSFEWRRQWNFVALAANVMTIAVLFGVTCCCREVARRFPLNYVFLFAVTLGIGISTGFAAATYTKDSVVMAFLTTAAVVFVLTAYACLTKTDFTGMGPYLIAAVMTLMAFGFVMMLFSMFTGDPVDPTLHKLYACAGALIFSLYIVYDTQLIVGGTHKKCEFSVDDYVFAALSLYLDIINLFLFLLEIMGDRQ
jgi:FtsH-binding integral membrane protein